MKIIRQISHHDLGLGHDSILGRSTLPAWSRTTGLARCGPLISIFGRLSFICLFREGNNLRRNIGGLVISTFGPAILSIVRILVLTLDRTCNFSWSQISAQTHGMTYMTVITHISATSETTTTSSTETAATTITPSFALTSTSSLSTTRGTFSLLSGRLVLASELNRDLALEDFFAGELTDSPFGFGRSGEINEGVTNGASITRIGRNGGGITRCIMSNVRVDGMQ